MQVAKRMIKICICVNKLFLGGEKSFSEGFREIYGTKLIFLSRAVTDTSHITSPRPYLANFFHIAFEHMTPKLIVDNDAR